MIRDKQQLIQDLQAAEAADFRAATLRAGGRILRRRRRERIVRITLGTAVIAIASAFAVSHIVSMKPMVTTQGPGPAPGQMRIPTLTDDELLALFPETPVGLVTLSDGKKRLIFPRPGDEVRFITRL